MYLYRCVSLLAPYCAACVHVRVRVCVYQIRVPAKKHMCQTSVNLMPCCIKESFHVNLTNSKRSPQLTPSDFGNFWILCSFT